MSVIQEPILLQPMEVSPELRLMKIHLEVRVEEKISGSSEAMREIDEREWTEGGEHREGKKKEERERDRAKKKKKT